jgi:D-alanyl-D-alanine carboxypeptidase
MVSAMGRTFVKLLRWSVVGWVALSSAAIVAPSAHAATASREAALEKAMNAFIEQRDSASPTFLTAGVADTKTKKAFASGDAMRMASVAKAFSGAAAVSAVASGKLSFDDTIKKVLPKQPAAWGDVTLAQLLQHTSGVPDFSASKSFRDALMQSLTTAPPPEQLLTYVANDPLKFTPGSKYEYSNSDNILVGLMVAAVDGTPYEQSLVKRVYTPLGLQHTSLPSGVEMPTPLIRGYQPDPPVYDDVTEIVAAGWAWASGGIVSTPEDANRFVRGYASGQLADKTTQAAQFRFRAGGSEPTGPGTNSAGLGIFRYRTRCGVVYGHTGNTFGYTQFIAATRDGKRSTVVSINSQMTHHSHPKLFAELRAIYTLATCAALKG